MSDIVSAYIEWRDRAEKAEALVKELKSEIEDMTQRFHDEVESRRLTYIENKKLDAELLKRAEARVKKLDDERLDWKLRFERLLEGVVFRNHRGGDPYLAKVIKEVSRGEYVADYTGL